jgi:hypothetical protein
MSIIVIIGAAVMIQYLGDLQKGDITIKPLIGGGIVLLLLAALADGVSAKAATYLAWIILLGALFNNATPLGSFLKSQGGTK